MVINFMIPLYVVMKNVQNKNTDTMKIINKFIKFKWIKIKKITKRKIKL